MTNKGALRHATRNCAKARETARSTLTQQRAMGATGVSKALQYTLPQRWTS